MKKRKNIIKKTELTKVFKLSYKKEFKHYFKEPRLKNKFFSKILFFSKSFNRLNKLNKFYKYNILNINKNLIIKRCSYFTFITNGLDLKYCNLWLDLTNLSTINSFSKKKTILTNSLDAEIIKYQKFIIFIDNNCIFYNSEFISTIDLFESTHSIYYSFLVNAYNFSYNLVLIYKYF